MVLEQVIFIVLNILFFVLLAAFVIRSGNGAAIYEQAYAKQIAIFLEKASPGMVISLNMSNALDIAKNKGKEFDKVVIISEGKVKVSLTGSGGYAYKYFSSYPVKIISNLDEKGIIKIEVGGMP